MSYQLFFSLSTGFSKKQRVPKGTHRKILEQIERTEEILGLTRTPTYTPVGEPQRPGWTWHKIEQSMLEEAGDKTDMNKPQWWLEDRERDTRIGHMSDTLLEHNHFVRRLYEDLSKWQGATWKRGESEWITTSQSVDFWGGLEILELPRELWNREHYTDHMEHLHELLTTGSSRGASLDCVPFDAKQAGALIMLFEDEIDQWGYDTRFAVPLDENLEPYDRIASSYDGGYDWCSKCGPINSDDFYTRCAICPHAKTGDCELKNDHPAEFEDEEDDDEEE